MATHNSSTVYTFYADAIPVATNARQIHEVRSSHEQFTILLVCHCTILYWNGTTEAMHSVRTAHQAHKQTWAICEMCFAEIEMDKQQQRAYKQQQNDKS